MRFHSAILSTAMAATLGACAAFAAADSPAAYNTVTDMVPRPEPALPALGPAGSAIVDPTFGTRILRVTDPRVHPDHPDGDFLTPGGSFEVNWNADTTMFWVQIRGDAMVFRFDGGAFRAEPLRNPDGKPLTLPFSGPFSYRRPNIMYGVRGLTVIEYDFNSRGTQVVFDGARAVPGAGGAAYAPSISDDDSKISLAFGGQQDTHPYIGWLDRNNGQYQVLETSASRLNGRPTNIEMGYGVHATYMDRTGRFVIINKGAGRKGGTSEWAVWDVQNGRVYDMNAEWSGHDASGFGVRVNQSGYSTTNPAGWEECQWAVRGLAEDQINNIRFLVSPDRLPAPRQWVSGHHSWNNARPDVMVPVIGSIARNFAQPNQPWRAWDNEIIGVATDGSGTVYRFAHHRSMYGKYGNFWDDPRGNVSQNGRYFAFTSNWGRSLGNRHDVFIVELPAGAAPAGQERYAPPQPEPQPAPQPAPQPEPEPNPQPAPVIPAPPAPGGEALREPPPMTPAETPAQDPDGPWVMLGSPSEGQSVGGMVSVSASAGGINGVASMELYVNGQAAGSVGSDYLQTAWRAPGRGVYRFTVVVTDQLGKKAAQSATARVQ